MISLLALTLCAIVGLYGKVVNGKGQGALPNVILRQNFGYMLTKVREVRVATYKAQMLFHLRLPKWNVTFDNRDIECDTISNITLPCMQIRRLLETAREVRARVQLYIQTEVRRLHELVLDLPTETLGRRRRGFFSDILAEVTGLASQDQLQSVRAILERIEGGIHTAAEMFGKSSKDLVAAFEIQQRRMNNVYDILSVYRKTIRRLQVELVATYRDKTGNTLFAALFKFLANTIHQISEANNLYTAVQMLMAGNVPHLIVSHDVLASALEHVQTHLQATVPPMSLCRHDFAYYYKHAAFSIFRTTNFLIVLIEAPVTVNSLNHPFTIYELFHLPLPTPETDSFYTLLSTDIHFIGFSRDADPVIQIPQGHILPTDAVWLLTDTPADFLDRSTQTCALALITGDLSAIKNLCRYGIHKTPIPRGVIRLYDNTFLFTNISTLQMHCLATNASSMLRSYKLTELQSVHAFSCQCDFIAGDEFRLIVDRDSCNETDNISVWFEVRFPINLVYLSEYFSLGELYNLTAETLLN